MSRTVLAVCCLSAVLAVSCRQPQSRSGAPDPGLAAEIAKIRAIDNHAHPMRAVTEGEQDKGYDALPPEALEPSPVPLRLRDDNPEYISAWKALYGYQFTDMAPGHLAGVRDRKARLMREKGDAYPAWILDQIGTEIMLANRVSMGRGLTAARFRWVPFADALMFPLSNERQKRENPDYKAFYPGEERLLEEYLHDAGLTSLPLAFDAYLHKVVSATLDRQKSAGAVALKFEAAYLRALDFAPASGDDARRVYEKYVKGGEPPAAGYKLLQDFLFRYIAGEAGRLGMAVHIHDAIGVGAYFNVAGASPFLLEPAFDDPALRKTNFVIVHGGYPFSKEAGALLLKPNVYLDFSFDALLIYPHELSGLLRNWLESMPEKVLFGTDAFPNSPEAGWEETGWLSAAGGRKALALALTGMVRDGEISRPRAIQVARLVLRENAVKLYSFR